MCTLLAFVYLWKQLSFLHAGTTRVWECAGAGYDRYAARLVLQGNSSELSSVWTAAADCPWGWWFAESDATQRPFYFVSLFSLPLVFCSWLRASAWVMAALWIEGGRKPPGCVWLQVRAKTVVGVPEDPVTVLDSVRLWDRLVTSYAFDQQASASLPPAHSGWSSTNYSTHLHLNASWLPKVICWVR